MRRGGGALQWNRPSPRRGRDAVTARWPRSIKRARFPPSSPRTSTICIRYPASLPNTSSNFTAIRLTPAALAADRLTIFHGSSSASTRQAARREPVKTATISFGQAMPEDAMHRATELAQQCDLFMAIGSSLVVWPAAGFPMLAKNCGARLVIINNEPTEQDDIADLVIRHDIGETLGPFVGN